jgi:sugar phosphate isomerase/epimerase
LARSDRVEDPFTLRDILEDTHSSGCTVLQICDYRPLDELSIDGLSALGRAAGDLGIRLELGTRGIGLDHLRRYLEMAVHLDATLIRSMLNTATERPSEAEAIESLQRAVPLYAERGVTLALETYEQVPSAQLVRIIEAVDSEALGVCLDPANCVAALERPRDVVAATAPYVKNWHVKDFAFATSRLGRIQPRRLPAWRGITGLRPFPQGRGSAIQRHQPDRGALAALATGRRDDLRDGSPMDATQYRFSKEQIMTGSQATVTVVGAGGKMGQRISNNLDKSDYRILYAENSPKGQEYIRGLGHEVTDTHEAAAQSDVVILAVPDVLLGRISADIVPTMKQGAVLLTLDPAAAYANLLYQRDGIAYAVAHPCHPSVFLERKTKEGAPTLQEGCRAPGSSRPSSTATSGAGVEEERGALPRTGHRRTGDRQQLAVLEPTLVEPLPA